jgi:hypothetical protein
LRQGVGGVRTLERAQGLPLAQIRCAAACISPTPPPSLPAADYIVPFALAKMRVLRLAPTLAAAVRDGVIVPAGSASEVELRAATVYAVARLTDEVNALRPAELQLVQAQLDYRLWKAFHATHGAHHLTVTTYY